MRITQSMLSNNMLRNLSTSYNKMGKLQDQITTGKKVNRPSDDPVVAMKGMGYCMQVDKVAQYQRNLGEAHNWLDSSEDALDKVGQALHRTKELMTKAAGGSVSDSDKEMILKEMEHLQQHMQSLGNTKVGDQYIFSGTKTGSPLFNDGVIETDAAFGKAIEIEVFDSVSLQVNTDLTSVFRDLNEMFDSFKVSIENPESENAKPLDDFVGLIDGNMDAVLTKRADIGARQNRVEMMENRLGSQEIIAIKQMSNNEDIDYEKSITEMITQESIHRAALSVGSRIIQPSLVDFLR
ncbi:flagellar hook-associated protein FlgL [Sporosarcina sp. HYO08]|uniref:flagellar hook-associated protein FlgL n=1 Tax=Sporosarcina sp. HYO08 TaxID=1759557 RepID=UPI00079A1CA1|nr:flagellar hook-associated protein FlgL [Sporosarcina sp. HYO08]KXH84138.1 flagellar biosynthesis protein FlgL [Sporosarcina sp. HYO08]